MKFKRLLYIETFLFLIGIGLFFVINTNKNKKIYHLKNEVENLKDELDYKYYEIRELEEDIEVLKEQLSEVQHYDENLKVNSGYLSSGVNFTGDIYETRIDGSFEGWDGETIFRMMDGSIWQQSSYDYTYHYAYSPSVIIFSKGGQTHMKVEGVSTIISVTRLR